VDWETLGILSAQEPSQEGAMGVEVGMVNSGMPGGLKAKREQRRVMRFETEIARPGQVLLDLP